VEPSPDINEIASSLQVSISLLRRRLHQIALEDEIAMPELVVLVRLDKGGPYTVTELAKLVGVASQSMGATVSRLDGRKLIDRRPDPTDGRRVYISISKAGRKLLTGRRDVRHRKFVEAISGTFNARELKQLKVAAGLLDRLAGKLSD
jgi:DNA-binding MarR family transcriptional regulator